MIDSTEVNKPMQFKIETPIISVESDTDNHLVDITTVLVTIVCFYLCFKIFKKWLRKF